MNKILEVIIIAFLCLSLFFLCSIVQSYKNDLKELNSKVDKLMVFLDLNDEEVNQQENGTKE